MCLFCDIAQKRVAAEIIYEDDLISAFLDVFPIRPGHAQVIPKAHIPYFEDLPHDVAGRIVMFGQRLARTMKSLYGADRVAFLFTGGDVPHAHAHVVPMHEKTDITSRRYIVESDLTFRSTPRASNAALRDAATALRSELGASQI